MIPRTTLLGSHFRIVKKTELPPMHMYSGGFFCSVFATTVLAKSSAGIE
jgi:hypothetical protein